MKIGILAAGTTPDELTDRYSTYAEMFVGLFDKAGKKFDYEFFDVREDVFPDSADVCDGWIITGSKFGVYDNLPWMIRLKQLILDIRATGKPLIGICFGHQIIADTLGGKVEKYQGGWGVSLHTYQLQNADSFTADKEFTINAMHQDQVVEKPADATVIASSDFCRYAGLMYDDQIMTFQAHPEFTVAYEADLVKARRGTVVPDEIADKGLAVLAERKTDIDSVKVAGWMAGFLTKPR